MPSSALDPLACEVGHDVPKRRRILIVDDDQDQVELLAGGFQRAGFQTFGAYSGQAAWRMAQRRPDLIVLDIFLPDGNGLEICRQLADDGRTADIPVILLSGVGGKDIVRRSRQAGCRFFLGKPYDPNALLALVESALSEPA